MNKFRSRLLFTFVSLIVFILVGLGLLLETVFENYYIDHAKERMVKETEYVATLAEEQGFDNVLKNPYVFEKLEEKIPASIVFLDEKRKFNIEMDKNWHLVQRRLKNFLRKWQNNEVK